MEPSQATVKKRPNWLKVKALYQRGEGSCRELAQRFGISESSVENKCFREKWRVEKKELEEKVKEKVEAVLVDEATAWVRDTIKRGWQARKEIDEAKAQAASPAIDPAMQDALSRVEARFDDMVRRALGLPDSPQEYNHSGEVKHSFSHELQDEIAQDFNRLKEELSVFRGAQ